MMDYIVTLMIKPIFTTLGNCLLPAGGPSGHLCVLYEEVYKKRPCVLQLSLRGNLGPYVMHISCRYQCTGNAIFGPVLLFKKGYCYSVSFTRFSMNFCMGGVNFILLYTITETEVMTKQI